MKLLTYEGLAHVISEIKAKFVQKETGKGLSANDYTTTEKNKLAGIAVGAQVNEVSASDLSTHASTTSGVHGIPSGAKFTDTTYKAATTSKDGLMASADKTKLDGVATGAQINILEGVRRNGVNLAITNKTVDVAVPTKVSDLTNDSGFQTFSQMVAYVANNSKFRYERHSQLDTPSAAEEGVIYLISSPSGVGYEEWIIVRSTQDPIGVWEKLGDTSDINLDGYVQTTDLVAITTAEINAMFSA